MLVFVYYRVEKNQETATQLYTSILWSFSVFYCADVKMKSKSVIFFCEIEYRNSLLFKEKQSETFLEDLKNKISGSDQILGPGGLRQTNFFFFFRPYDYYNWQVSLLTGVHALKKKIFLTLWYTFLLHHSLVCYNFIF